MVAGVIAFDAVRLNEVVHGGQVVGWRSTSALALASGVLAPVAIAVVFRPSLRSADIATGRNAPPFLLGAVVWGAPFLVSHRRYGSEDTIGTHVELASMVFADAFMLVGVVLGIWLWRSARTSKG